ncbi:MAG: endolytic transglycosylase MltG [Clostridiales bacterium]|nr:endolytic transglycosylase MltG [Clostridiales bacterium]
MNKLKDIIYDKNDIFVALIIVIIAGLIIHNRIEVIMAYPSELVAEASSSQGKVVSEQEWQPVIEEPSEEEETSDEEEPVNEEEETPESEEQVKPSDEPQVTEVTVKIEYGATGNQIAQILIDKGLISSFSEFYTAVEAANADTKLQAGTFKIPSNATPEEIISIITR